MLSALIRISFVDVLEDVLPAGQTLCFKNQQLLRENGVFEESLLDKISLPFVPSLFTKPEFLKLLQYLRIVAPLFTTDKVKHYFLLIVLPPCQLSNVILEIIKIAVSSCAKILAYDNLVLNCMVTVPCQLKHRFKETNRKMHPVTISFMKTPPIIGCSIETELPLVPLTNCRQSCW